MAKNNNVGDFFTDLANAMRKNPSLKDKTYKPTEMVDATKFFRWKKIPFPDNLAGDYYITISGFNNDAEGVKVTGWAPYKLVWAWGAGSGSYHSDGDEAASTCFNQYISCPNDDHIQINIAELTDTWFLSPTVSGGRALFSPSLFMMPLRMVAPYKNTPVTNLPSTYTTQTGKWEVTNYLDISLMDGDYEVSVAKSTTKITTVGRSGKYVTVKTSDADKTVILVMIWYNDYIYLRAFDLDNMVWYQY